jgi:hypothetical protein
MKYPGLERVENNLAIIVGYLSVFKACQRVSLTM